MADSRPSSLVLSMLLGCGQAADESSLSAEEQAAFEHLAAALTEYRTLDAGEVRLDTDEIDELYRVLIAVHTFDDPEWNEARDDFVATVSRDDILDSLRLRTRTIEVDVVDDAAWLDDWNDGGANTGNTRLDGLIDEFQLEVVPISTSRDDLFWLTSDGPPMNRDALARSVLETGAFDRTTPDGEPTDGWTMRHNFMQVSWPSGMAIHANPLLFGGWRYRVSMGWMDCPSGCIYGRRWTFFVDSAGRARIVDIQGDEYGAIEEF